MRKTIENKKLQQSNKHLSRIKPTILAHPLDQMQGKRAEIHLYKCIIAERRASCAHDNAQNCIGIISL
jgi:hypothetical protein